MAESMPALYPRDGILGFLSPTGGASDGLLLQVSAGSSESVQQADDV